MLDRKLYANCIISTHAPAGGATRSTRASRQSRRNFYSRPCGRGDAVKQDGAFAGYAISTHAPAGGATLRTDNHFAQRVFLLTPLREGRQGKTVSISNLQNFYSRPCGRGDLRSASISAAANHFYSRPCGRGDKDKDMRALFNSLFLLTPLREGRPDEEGTEHQVLSISTHAPAGGATAAFA